MRWILDLLDLFTDCSSEYVISQSPIAGVSVVSQSPIAG